MATAFLVVTCRPSLWHSPHVASTAPFPCTRAHTRRVVRRPRRFTYRMPSTIRMKITPTTPTTPSSSPSRSSSTTPPSPSPSSQAGRPTTATSTATIAASSSSPKVLSRLTALSTRVQTIKCPFWRRRFTDTLEMVSQVAVWAIRTRHKSLPLPPLPLISPSSSCSGLMTTDAKGRQIKPKTTHLDMHARVGIIRDDFVKRQYYVTGRLTPSLYRDDCLFDSPDPDGHVRGLAKFCNAAAGLFDTRLSRVDLIDIYAVDQRTVIAEWRLQGALMLPWRPYIKPYVGETTYTFNGDGLVCSHVDKWQISVFDAFLSVLFKNLGTAPAPPASVLRQRKIREGRLQWLDDDSSIEKGEA